MSSLMAPLYYSLLFMCAKKYTGYRWGWVNIAGISWFFYTWSYVLNIVNELAEVGELGWHTSILAVNGRWVNSWRIKSNLICLVIGQTTIIQFIHNTQYIIQIRIYKCTHTLPCLFHSLQNVINKCGLRDKKMAFGILMGECVIR